MARFLSKEWMDAPAPWWMPAGVIAIFLVSLFMCGYQTGQKSGEESRKATQEKRVPQETETVEVNKLLLTLRPQAGATPVVIEFRIQLEKEHE